MEKFKIPAKDGFKLVSAEIIDNCVVVTYEESKKLRLSTGNGTESLCIMYGKDYLGYISYNGECNILSTEIHRKTYTQWVNDGMPVCHSEVMWRGSNYKITDAYKLICVSKSPIYDFILAIYCTHCNDLNIQRYPHNDTPIAY